MNFVAVGKLTPISGQPRLVPKAFPLATRFQCRAQTNPLKTMIVSTVLSGALLSSLPSQADVIRTVAPNEVSAMGAPLPVERVEKKRVWLVFTTGAASLFVFINVIENNASWFPAVTRANKVLTARRKQRIKGEEEDESLVKSVEDGLEDARKQRALPTPQDQSKEVLTTKSLEKKFINGQKS